MTTRSRRKRLRSLCFSNSCSPVLRREDAREAEAKTIEWLLDGGRHGVESSERIAVKCLSLVS
jgi:hypothetical protein